MRIYRAHQQAHVAGGDSGKKEGTSQETTGGPMKRKREEQETASPSAVMSTCPSEEQPCVSMVIRVEHKEGVSWRNAGVALTEEQVGLVLCFNVRVAVMGPVVTWGRDPKNRQMLEKEADKGKRVRSWPHVSHRAPVSSVLSPGAPGLLRSVGCLVPCNPARLNLPTGGHRLAGQYQLVPVTSGQSGLTRLLIGSWACPTGSWGFDWLRIFCSVWGGSLHQLHPSGQT